MTALPSAPSALPLPAKPRPRSLLAAAGALACLALGGPPPAQAELSVDHLQASQRAGTKLVDIDYDLSGATSPVTVGLQISSDSGRSWRVSANSLSGSIGQNIPAGTGRRITWDVGADWDQQYSPQVRFLVTAEESNQSAAPVGMVRVTGGALPADSWAGAQRVDAFYIGKYEVQWSEWQSVRSWAVTHGYSFGAGAGRGAAYPVTDVNWYDALKWCNARSEQEGLAPVYTVTGAPYRTGDAVPDVSSSAKGYRLPSEKEWEFAARGGVLTHGYTYSGSNDINAVAWYDGNSGGAIHTVGTKLANELDLFDMSGNAWEWCFDVYSGTDRVNRGGGLDNYAYYCRAASRSFTGPADRYYALGFRVLSSSVSTAESADVAVYTGARFQVVEGSFTWHDAKADAEARGGRLAVLDTQEKIESSIQYLAKSGLTSDYWIGFSDEETEGVWKWIGETAGKASYWNLDTGEPNNGRGNHEEDAAMVRGVWGWRWNDGPVYTQAGYLYEFIAEIKIAPNQLNGSLVGAGIYPPGTTASLTAAPNPGYLFTGWTGDASGSANPLSFIMAGNKTIGADFVADLRDSDGDGLSNFAESVTHGTDPAQADSDGDGLSDGYELGVGRYEVVLGSRTWGQAKGDAEAKGGSLATLLSLEEWSQAQKVIGPDALLDVNGLWIGATDAAVEGSWKWLNGDAVSWSNWAGGQPDNLNDSDFAAIAGELGGDAGKWYDYRSATTRDGYLFESGFTTDPKKADVDRDGLNDGQEKAAGSSPFLADSDGDGLTDAEEVNLTKTNPTVADSDGDGLADAADDQDGDGVTNFLEIRTHGTNPILADTDGDGLSDGAELATAGSFYQAVLGSFTQPQAAADAAARHGRLAAFPSAAVYARTLAKIRRSVPGYLWLGLSDRAAEGTWKWTDGSDATYARWMAGQPDGVTQENDAVVVENALTWADAAPGYAAAGYLLEQVGLNPLAADTDSDGLSDQVEVVTGNTDPFLDDSDGDGLTDGAEVNTHHTNPKAGDSDSDGLSDRAELVDHHTNPNRADSDDDGFSDLFEINTGFNPSLATSSPDAISSIESAVEFNFNAAKGVSYRIEQSADLENWSTLETDIVGAGDVVTRYYPTKNQATRYFRPRRN